MKKILSLLLIGTIFASSATPVYAQVTELKEKRDATPVFEEHYPERLNDYLTNKEAHTNFHEARKALREETVTFFEDMRNDSKAEIEEIKAQVEEGVLSKEDAKVLIEEIRANGEISKEYYQAMREEINSVQEEKKAENELLRTEFQETRESLKAELQSDDTNQSTVQGLLDDLLDFQSQHLDIDFYYADMVDAILNAYEINQ